MASAKILVYSGPLEKANLVKRLLSSKFEIRPVEPRIDSLYPEFERCSVFLDASMKVPITKDLLMRSPALELIVTATTGASHIDHAALKEKKVPLMTLIDQKEKIRDITAAAEHSWLLLLACARRLRGAVLHTSRGEWNRESFPGVMLKGKTLGVIGLGRVGTWMSRYAQAFGMKVVGYDPFQKDMPPGVELVSLEEIFTSSDFITVHVGLTAENRGLISESLLKSSRPGLTLINTSRGELIDENALVEGLKSGRIGAVGVDVLSDEPNIQRSALWQYAQDHENVVITPHIGGFCPEALDIVLELSCRRVLSYFGFGN